MRNSDLSGAVVAMIIIEYCLVCPNQSRSYGYNVKVILTAWQDSFIIRHCTAPLISNVQGKCKYKTCKPDNQESKFVYAYEKLLLIWKFVEIQCFKIESPAWKVSKLPKGDGE